MAQVYATYKTRAAGCVFVLIISLLLMPATVLGLGVPITVTTGSLATPLTGAPLVVSATTPTITPKAPVPSVTVTAPTVEGPSVSVVPHVSVKPSPAAPVPASAPAVPAHTPAVPAHTPTVPAHTPAVPAHTPTVSVSTPAIVAPSVSSRVSGASSAPAAAAGSTASSSSSSGAGSAPNSAGSDANAAAPGYGQLPRKSGVPPAVVPDVARSMGVSSRASAARERRLRAAVARLRGCLTQLSSRRRVALQLRTGLGEAQALGPRAAAARLHLELGAFSRLEREALRELHRTAQSHGCTSAGRVASAALSFIGAHFASSGKGAGTGGVEAARYVSSGSAPRVSQAQKSSADGSLLGIDVSNTNLALLLLIPLLAIGLTIWSIFLNSSRRGTIDQELRRIIDRFSR